MKYLPVCVSVLLIFPIACAMDNSTLIRRHVRIEEEHNVYGHRVRNYVEATIDREFEEEAASFPCVPLWVKNFVRSDFSKASILLLVAGATTLSTVAPSSPHFSSSFNQTTMCPIHNCALERSAGFKQGIIYCSLSMSALLCCSQCVKTCGDCGE